MLMTAKEARERYEQIVKKRLEDEKTKIETIINTAIENSEKDYCYLEMEITMEAEKWLTSLGYRLCDCDGTKILVRW